MAEIGYEAGCSHQSAAFISEVEAVRDEYIAKSTLKMSKTLKGYGSSKAYAYNEFSEKLDELITKLKTK